MDYCTISGVERIKRIKILRIDGERISSYKINNNTLNITAPAGIYFIHLIDENNINYVGKLVKL